MNQEPKQPNEVRRLLNQLSAQRLLSAVPITWDEIDEMLPSLNRQEAERYLNGQLDDPRRAALFDVLFRFHPGLRAVLRPQEAMPEPPPVIVFRRAVQSRQAEEVPLRLAAKPASGVATTIRLISDEGYSLDLFPSNEHNGYHEVYLDGGKPAGTVTLYVAGEPIEWVQPLDDEGFGRVRTSALAEVLAGTAALEMIVSPADATLDTEA